MLALILNLFVSGANATVKFQAEAMTTPQLIADDQWWRIYTLAFSESIRTRPESIIKYHRQGSGTAVRVVRADADRQTVGMATYLFLDYVPAAYLMYFAIDPGWVRQGAGGELIRFVQQETRQHFAQKEIPSLGIVLEAEIPTAADTFGEANERSHRLAFYKKIGGQVLSENYIMPPVHEGLPPTPMQLILLPEAAVDLTAPVLTQQLTDAIYQKCFPDYYRTLAAKQPAGVVK